MADCLGRKGLVLSGFVVSTQVGKKLLNVQGAYLLQNHPVKVFHNQLLHVLVECDCCLLVVAVADLEGKPHIIDKGREAVPPLLWRKGVRLSLFLLLLIFFPCLPLPSVRRPLCGLLCFCRG